MTIFSVCFDKPITVHCTTISTFHMETNLFFYERTKHVGINYHFISDKIVRGFVTTKHVSTKIQLFDILTKALGKKALTSFLIKLGI